MNRHSERTNGIAKICAIVGQKTTTAAPCGRMAIAFGALATSWFETEAVGERRSGLHPHHEDFICFPHPEEARLSAHRHLIPRNQPSECLESEVAVARDEAAVS